MTKASKWALGILGALAVLFVFVFVVSFLLFVGTTRDDGFISAIGDKIAVVELKEVISSSERVVYQLKKHRENSSVKAIVLRVDSPGGAVVPSQEMYEEVRKTREAGKPIIVTMGSVAASGGYYVSCGATKIVANRGTLTGSIGVISQFLQLEELMSKIGIASTTVKTGKFKDSGSPFRKFSEEDRKYWEGLIKDTYNQFLSVVVRERQIPHERLLSIADGRVFTGEQALQLGLVDTLGTYEDAIRIAADMVGIRGEPVVVKMRDRRRLGLVDLLFASAKENILEAKKELIDQEILQYKLPYP
ncbi:MAG: signal peptide peptidase SppA [Bacteroidota bacterium]